MENIPERGATYFAPSKIATPPKQNKAHLALFSSLYLLLSSTVPQRHSLQPLPRLLHPRPVLLQLNSPFPRGQIHFQHLSVMLLPVFRISDAQLRLDQVAELVAAFEEDSALDALRDHIYESGQGVLVIPPYCLFFFCQVR